MNFPAREANMKTAQLHILVINEKLIQPNACLHYCAHWSSRIPRINISCINISYKRLQIDEEAYKILTHLYHFHSLLYTF